MPTAYSSDEVDLHQPLFFGNKCSDSPPTTSVFLRPQAMLMAMVNHWCTELAHCELITADQTRTNSTFIRPRASVTQTWLFADPVEDPHMTSCNSWLWLWPLIWEFQAPNSKSKFLY